MAVVVALGWFGAATVTAPGAEAAPGDVVVIGDREAPSASSSGYQWFDPGPVAGAPAAQVDAASSTVTVAVDDAVTGSKASLTMAWPARPGSWSLDFNGPDPEQTVTLTRGAKGCTFTAGTLTVHRAEATPTGQVGVLSADVTGSCRVSNGGDYAGAQIRIGDTDPARAVAIPRATPATISTGALTGTVVTHEVTLTNTGAKPWKVGTAATASSNSWSPQFRVVAESNHCTGLTLTTGQTCTLQVAATAPSNYTVYEHLLVGGDSGTTLVVPLRLEGYTPVEPPTAVTTVAGRLSATVSWQPPTRLPTSGYRVYDVTSGTRSLVATAAASATEVNVTGAGPRRLAVVAANGRFAESPEAVVDVPAVSSELVGNDWYGYSVAVATDTSGAQPRPLTLERVDLDPSRTRWVTAGYSDVRVCPVATEQCTTVPGTPGTTDAESPATPCGCPMAPSRSCAASPSSCARCGWCDLTGPGCAGSPTSRAEGSWRLRRAAPRWSCATPPRTGWNAYASPTAASRPSRARTGSTTSPSPPGGCW